MPSPQHVAIILDGNRRFAKTQGLAPVTGHEAGAKNLEVILPHLAKRGVKEVTLYVFSTENFKRSESEKEHLFKLLTKYFKSKKTIETFQSYGARIYALGNLTQFPQDIKDALQSAQNQTKDCSKLRINFMMGYGGRDEIIKAVQEISELVKVGKLNPTDINEETIGCHLYLTSQPDLIIRTGGDIRTSNFLPWQSTYSEWFFENKFWPQLSTDDIDRILEEFNNRKRNFGK